MVTLSSATIRSHPGTPGGPPARDPIKLTDYLSDRSPRGWAFLGGAHSCEQIPPDRGITYRFKGPIIEGREQILRFQPDVHLNIAQFHCLQDTTYPFIIDAEDTLILKFRLQGNSEDSDRHDGRVRRLAGHCYVLTFGNGSERALRSRRGSNVADVAIICTRRGLARFINAETATIDRALRFADAFAGSCEPGPPPGMPMTPAMRRIATDILTCRYAPDLSWLYQRAKMIELLCELSHAYARQHAFLKDGRACTRRRNLGKLHQARGILDSDLCAVPSLGALARTVGMSRTNLVVGFRQAFDVSVSQYVRERRLAVAKDLLDDSELPVSEVAHRVGFSSAASFITAFKALHGTTPGHLRR